MLDAINDVDDEGYVPDYLTQDRIEGRFEQRYELMLKRDGWDVPHFSRTLQQSPDCIEFTGQGYRVQPFEALHSSPQVRCLRRSTGSSPP